MNSGEVIRLKEEGLSYTNIVTHSVVCNSLGGLRVSNTIIRAKTTNTIIPYSL